MEQTEILRYGSELRRFNVVGVTFKNKDGEDRQSIIERLQVGAEYNVRLERYLYEGEPAYYVVINEKIVGNVPKRLAAEFAAKEDQDCWLLITKAGVHGGGPQIDDDGDYDIGNDKSFGVHVTVKIVSPAEREARHMWVDDDGNLHQDELPEVASSPITKVEMEPQPKPKATQTAQKVAEDPARAERIKHEIIRRNTITIAVALCIVLVVVLKIMSWL